MTAAPQLAPDPRLVETFRCERFACTLSKRACLERRAKQWVKPGRKRGDNGERFVRTTPYHPQCAACPVGAQLEQDLGAVATTQIRTPAAVLKSTSLTYRPAAPSPVVAVVPPPEPEPTPDPEPETHQPTEEPDMSPKPAAVADDPPRRLCSKCKRNPLRRDNESGVCVQCARPWEKRRETGEAKRMCALCGKNELRHDNRTGVCAECHRTAAAQRHRRAAVKASKPPVVLSLIPGEFDPAKLSDDQLVACLDEARQRVTKRREDADRLEKAIGGAP